MQPASAQKPRSSPRIQPTSDKEQQDLSYVEYDTMKSSPRGRKQLDVVKVNSVSEMGNQNWSPNGKQSAVNVSKFIYFPSNLCACTIYDYEIYVIIQ